MKISVMKLVRRIAGNMAIFVFVMIRREFSNDDVSVSWERKKRRQVEKNTPVNSIKINFKINP